MIITVKASGLLKDVTDPKEVCGYLELLGYGTPVFEDKNRYNVTYLGFQLPEIEVIG